MQKALLWAASMEGLVFVLTVMVTALAVSLAGFVSAYYRGRAAAARKFAEMEKKIDYLEHAMWNLTDAEVRRTWKNQHKQWGGSSAPMAFREKPEAPARAVTSEEPVGAFVGSYRTAASKSPEPTAPPPKKFSWGKVIGQASVLTGTAAWVSIWKTGQSYSAGSITLLGIGGAVIAAGMVVFFVRRA